MADTREVVLEWQKSPQYRFIPAQNVTVTTADTGDGPSALLHFTNTLVDIKEESFSAERNAEGGVVQTGQVQFKLGPAKYWEATVKLRAQDVGSMIPLLLRLFPAFPEETQEEIRKAFAILPSE
jgi:hypothetical protein